MANLRFLINSTGLVNTAIYKLVGNNLEALEPNGEEFEQQTIKGNNAQRLDTGSSDAPIYNWLGLQVFSSARLINPDTGDAFELLTVLFEVRQDKNIDKVSVTGLNGTIKTYINDGDFQINMKVILTTDNLNDYPIDDVKKLIEFLRLNKAVKVVSDFLLLFDIYSVVFESYSIPQIEGTQNTAIFEISAVSDTPIELIEDV